MINAPGASDMNREWRILVALEGTAVPHPAPPLGYTLDTPLAAWYAEVRMQHLVDGPDEVRRWRIGRNVLAAQRTSGTTAAAAGGDLF